MIQANQTVNIKPEFCDDPAEALIDFLVISGEEDGRPRITIEAQLGMNINPTEVVEAHMVNVK